MYGPFIATYLPLSVPCIDSSSKTPSLWRTPCSRGLDNACVCTVQNWQCCRLAADCCGHKYHNLRGHGHNRNGADTIRPSHLIGLHFRSHNVHQSYVLAFTILSDTHRERARRLQSKLSPFGPKSRIEREEALLHSILISTLGGEITASSPGPFILVNTIFGPLGTRLLVLQTCFVVKLERRMTHYADYCLYRLSHRGYVHFNFLES